jgi:hypothetical protein
MRTVLLSIAIFSAAAPAYAAGLIWAGGQWAAIDRGTSCEAGARSIRIALKDKVQAHSGFAFDGSRNGQFFAQLSRIPRAGSTVVLTVGSQPFLLAARGDWAWSTNRAQEAAIIAATRAGGGMRIESRDQEGSRFADRYLLDGAATAIDAAAAHCAGKMQRS